METTIIDFWCRKCKKDILKYKGFKIVRSKEELWANLCPYCGMEMIRFAKSPLKDPYYRESEKMQREAKKYANDFLQPDHPDFDRIYPWVRKERERKQEEAERRKWEEEQNTIPGQRKKFKA